MYILMMHRLRRYDVFRFAQNDVAPLRFAMMRCLPQCAVRQTSFAQRTSLGEANIICYKVRFANFCKHHSKKVRKSITDILY